MLFVASKLLQAITQPLFWLALLGFRAAPDALLRPLENR
jgi:hypothetical protein